MAGMQELYLQMLPTKIYHHKKTRCHTGSDLTCRLCSKAPPETQAHVLAGCCILAETKYLSRHNTALQILFFKLLMVLELVDSVPPWYSPAQPKALYENSRAKAYWDVPLYAESTEVRANRIDARIVNKESKRVMLLEMSWPLDLKYRGKGRREDIEVRTATSRDQDADARI